MTSYPEIQKFFRHHIWMIPFPSAASEISLSGEFMRRTSAPLLAFLLFPRSFQEGDFLPARYDIASGFFHTRSKSDAGMTCVLHFYHMMSPLLCELAQRQEAEFAQNKAHQVMKTQKTSHSHFRQ